MRKEILPKLILAFALAAAGSACGPTAGNEHDAMNHNAMNHNAMPLNSNISNSNNAVNHDAMNHKAMPTDASAANAPYDLQFIDTMIHHHEGAVEMSETALKNSENAELKQFAQKIIDDQRREIQKMTDWRKQWFGGDAPPAKNMQLEGMADSMKMMTPEHMKTMGAMTGKAFDTHYLDMMIPHHKGAVLMAQEALKKSQKPEIKTLAGEIIREQEAEIGQMTSWKAKWAK